MFTHTEHRSPDPYPGFSKSTKTRRNDRREAIRRKAAFLVDGLTVKGE